MKSGQIIQVDDGKLLKKFDYSRYGEILSRENLFDGKALYRHAVQKRNLNAQIIQQSETLGDVTTHYDYTYDTLGRLVEVQTDGNTTESYEYDANGNRQVSTSTLVGDDNVVAFYSLDDAINTIGDTTYTYSEDGYLKTKTDLAGTTTYSYGTRGELHEVHLPDNTKITYKHNALNQRVAKLIDAEVVEKYLWLNLTTLLATLHPDDTIKQRYEYSSGRMPYKFIQDEQSYYLHYNQVGSLRAVSDSSGAIVKEIQYDSFGQIILDSNKNFVVPFGFAGGLYDQHTKLSRFGYRDYDAKTGKWTAKDPIGFSGGDVNLYGYVLGDPVNLVDPEGKSTISNAVYILLAIYLTNEAFNGLTDEIIDKAQKIVNIPKEMSANLDEESCKTEEETDDLIKRLKEANENLKKAGLNQMDNLLNPAKRPSLPKSTKEALQEVLKNEFSK
jgi:RHS repeat-associated protein